MRFSRYPSVVAILCCAGSVFAESHPAWWRYASPEATALVGIRWERVQASPFGEAIAGELQGDGGLGFPDLDCLKTARQILISSPALLGVASGNFPSEALREQALRKGLKKSAYRDIEIWITPGRDTLSIARLSDQVALIGRVKVLQDAIDRSLTGEELRAYSPLLSRAARYAQDDLWVVASRLPDPLAGRFVPIDAEADGFEGSVSLQGGLRLAATFTTGSEPAAEDLAEALRQMMTELPPMARAIQFLIEQNNVTLAMAVSQEQLLAGLRTTPAPKPPPAEPVKPAGPQVIRIFGLDDGPREIVVREGAR